MSNHKLAKAVADMGFYEFRRQLEYKCQLYGSKYIVVDRWFPSSKTLGTPGSGIYSTILDDSYATYSGTSMASPHVAGVAALVLAENPNLTYAEVKETILDNVDPNEYLNKTTVSGGRLNAEKALEGLGVPGTHTVELKSGESKKNVNFGYQEIIPGSISGSKWNDSLNCKA